MREDCHFSETKESADDFLFFDKVYPFLLHSYSYSVSYDRSFAAREDADQAVGYQR